jgi:hypothetical protein
LAVGRAKTRRGVAVEVLTNFVGGDLIADEAEEELEVEVPDPAASSTIGRKVGVSR